MQESQQTIKQKKTRRLTLTGIKFPPPPPYISQRSQIREKIKEQEISNTSSSSEQQMYYENYFMIQLQTLIHDLIGQNIHYEIQQLKEHNSEEDQQIVDVVVKVEFGVGDQEVVMERIRVLKEINQKEKKDDKIRKQKMKQQVDIKKQASKSNKGKIKQKISLQQQQTQSTSTRNLRPQKLFGSAEWKQQQNQVHQMNQMNQSSINISSQLKKSRKSKKMDNETQKQKIKQQYGILKSKEDKGSEDGDDEGHHSIQAIEIQQKKLRKTENKVKPNKIACACVTIVFVIISLFVVSILLKNNSPSKQYQNAESNKNQGYRGAKFPYEGDIGYNIKKKTYIIPAKYQDETNKLQVFIQILPAVKNPSQSLHPMNLTYYRPSMAKLFTFPSIDKHDNKKSYVLNYTHGEQQLQKYLDGFGNNEKQRMIGLYTELHKQGSNLPTILVQAQYYYLSKKYGIDQMETKPLCLIAYTRNSYSTNRFLPFFKTLFSQNYTNYRLIYIQDSPTQQYESVRVMNNIWTHFYNQLANVGSGQFYFLQLDQYIGSILAKTAAARELCGVGDIVVEIDGLGELIGRQSLMVLGFGYDGGSQRMTLMPKAEVTNYPYFEIKNRKQSHLKSQQLGRTKDQRPKSPEMLTPQKKGNSENSIQMPNQVNRKQTNEIKQDRIFIARVIGDIWMAYSNYMYSQKITDSDEIKYNFVNSTSEQERYHNFSSQLKMSINPQQILTKFPRQHLSSPCLKSYILPLQTKLDISKSKHTSNFGYDLEIYHKMLQLSGRFNPSMKIRHYQQTNEPLCYRSDVMVVSECEQKMKVYEQVVGMRTNELMSLNRILGEQAREKYSRQQNLEQLNRLIQRLGVQMSQQCNNQKNE